MSSDPEHFTFDYFLKLVAILRGKGFQFSKFHADPSEHAVYLRHDIDYSIHHAYHFAKWERRQGIESTYFVMIGSDEYDPLDFISELREIRQMGHDIGLHYVLSGNEDHVKKILVQATFLSELVHSEVRSFSIHRPEFLASQGIDVTQFKASGLINTYSPDFFQPDHYISDSKRHWRCGVPHEFLDHYSHEWIQILTHPIWWSSERLEKIPL